MWAGYLCRHRFNAWVPQMPQQMAIITKNTARAIAAALRRPKSGIATKPIMGSKHNHIVRASAISPMSKWSFLSIATSNRTSLQRRVSTQSYQGQTTGGKRIYAGFRAGIFHYRMQQKAEPHFSLSITGIITFLIASNSAVYGVINL